MNLPVPTPEEVESFKGIYLREFGIELTPEEAWEAATTTLQLFYLGTYGDPSDPPSKRVTPQGALESPTFSGTKKEGGLLTMGKPHVILMYLNRSIFPAFPLRLRLELTVIDEVGTGYVNVPTFRVGFTDKERGATGEEADSIADIVSALGLQRLDGLDDHVDWLSNMLEEAGIEMVSRPENLPSDLEADLFTQDPDWHRKLAAHCRELCTVPN